jgi:hypothetical protein
VQFLCGQRSPFIELMLMYQILCSSELGGLKALAALQVDFTSFKNKTHVLSQSTISTFLSCTIS